MPQHLQELLGFNQATSYLGFINGRHPLRLAHEQLARQLRPGYPLDGQGSGP